jgi:multidrug resistance efflux pump
MPIAFSRTMRSLRADRSRFLIPGILLISTPLAAWIAWLAFARVSIYAVSDKSRLETGSQPLQSLYTGRITANYLALGRSVKAGETLIELDTRAERLQLSEEVTQSGAFRAEMGTLQQEIATEEKALHDDERAMGIGVEEAEARLREAEAVSEYVRVDAERKATLHREGLLPQLDYMRADSDARKQKATVESLRLAIARQKQEGLTRVSERQSRIQSLRREASRLSGQAIKQGSTVHRLESEMLFRRIAAPVDGTIGEVAPLRVGAVISPGEKLGSILRSEGLSVVAQFNPALAAGRIRHGQHARLRLAGFPWTQYGTTSAIVVNVANEVRDGSLRVELRPAAGGRVPLQHGMPGVTEIEIDRISPAALVLRLAGQLLASQSQSGESAR